RTGRKELQGRRRVEQAARDLRSRAEERQGLEVDQPRRRREGEEGESVTDPALVLPIVLFLLGACVGSCLNVVIYRLPREDLSISKPRRSFCPSCKRQIPARENLPIVSYVLLGGRCRGCKAEIPVRYLVVEILTA